MVMNGRSLRNYRVESNWSDWESERTSEHMSTLHVPVIYHVRVEVCDDECSNGNADNNSNNNDDKVDVGDNDGYIYWIITSELVRGKIAWSQRKW